MYDSFYSFVVSNFCTVACLLFNGLHLFMIMMKQKAVPELATSHETRSRVSNWIVWTWRTSKFRVKFISFSPRQRVPRARDNCTWQRLSAKELTFSAINSLYKSDSFMNNYRRVTPNTTLPRENKKEKKKKKKQWDQSIGKEKKKLKSRVPYTSKSTPC